MFQSFHSSLSSSILHCAVGLWKRFPCRMPGSPASSWVAPLAKGRLHRALQGGGAGFSVGLVLENFYGPSYVHGLSTEKYVA